MKKANTWITRSLIAAVVVVLGSALLATVATPVVAQVRAALVKDADHPARQPFSAGTGIVNFPSGGTSVSDTLLTVPAAKRAVIEHVSCIDFLATSNNFIRMQLETTLNGLSAKTQFVHTLAGASFAADVDIWSFSQPIAAYADPSTDVRVSALRRTGAGLAGIECYVNGYFVDLP